MLLILLIMLLILLNGDCAMVSLKEIHCWKTRWYSILQFPFNDSKTLPGFDLLESLSSDMEKCGRHASERNKIVLRITVWKERQEKKKLIVAGRWKAWRSVPGEQVQNKKGQGLIYNQTISLGWNITLIHSLEDISIAWLMWMDSHHSWGEQLPSGAALVKVIAVLNLNYSCKKSGLQ